MENKILDIFSKYNDNTKNICFLNSIAFLLILIVISPLNIGFFTKLFLNIIILYLLFYCIKTNYFATINLYNINDIFSNPSLASIRNNMCISFIYTFLMSLLAFYFLINIFF